MADRKVHVYESADGEYRVAAETRRARRRRPDTLMVRNNSNEELVFYVDVRAFNANNP